MSWPWLAGYRRTVREGPVCCGGTGEPILLWVLRERKKERVFLTPGDMTGATLSQINKAWPTRVTNTRK